MYLFGLDVIEGKDVIQSSPPVINPDTLEEITKNAGLIWVNRIH